MPDHSQISDGETCSKFQTKVYVCTVDETQSPSVGMWVTVGVSHLVLLMALLAYFVVPELRCLQVRYHNYLQILSLIHI